MKNVNQKNVKYTANARIHNTRNEIEREERESELKKKKNNISNHHYHHHHHQM